MLIEYVFSLISFSSPIYNCFCMYACQVTSAVSDSLRPHGLYSPWNSPGQNTGVGSLSLLQGIFPTQGSYNNSKNKNSRQIPILANLLNKASEISCKTILEKYGIITLYLLPMPQYLLVLVLRKYLNYSNFSISKCSKLL